jgi:hypothetical protein
MEAHKVASEDAYQRRDWDAYGYHGGRIHFHKEAAEGKSEPILKATTSKLKEARDKKNAAKELKNARAYADAEAKAVVRKADATLIRGDQVMFDSATKASMYAISAQAHTEAAAALREYAKVAAPGPRGTAERKAAMYDLKASQFSDEAARFSKLAEEVD